MSSVLKPLLCVAAAALVGCRDYHYERLMARERIGTDTIIIKETGGEALAGGMLVYRQTKDSLHKVYMDSFVYDEVQVMGLNSKKDSLKIKCIVNQIGPLPNDTLRIWRTDTLTVAWNTSIESWKRDYNVPLAHANTH